MKKLILASITLAAILAISTVAPAAAIGKPQKEFDYHLVVVWMNGEIDSAPIETFVDYPLTADENKRLMKEAWVDFAQLVQATPPDVIVDNTVICTEISLHVWSWTSLYGNLRSVAMCV